MSFDVNEYLRKLLNHSKLNKILTAEDTELAVMIDPFTADYLGSVIRFNKDDKHIELHTSDKKAKIYGDSKSYAKLDTILALALDREVLDIFNVNKLDEENFDDLKDQLKADIEYLHEKETKDIEKELKDLLKAIKKSDYDEDLIRDELVRVKITEKSDHLVIEKIINGSTVKYNEGKNKLTIKNDYNYKVKTTPEAIVKGFDVDKFMAVANDYHRKKIYNQKRLELDDGLEDSNEAYHANSFFHDKESLDLASDDI